MSKNKNNKPVWSSRITKKTSAIYQKVGSSLNVDKRLYKEDIKASSVHVEMLFKKKIISLQIKNKILWGLKRILNEFNKKKFKFDEKNEDIHMSVEKRLFELVGEDAGYIHTARSRNDQVLTDFKLWLRDATDQILKELSLTNRLIIKIAEKNIKTIMPSFTHLKNQGLQKSKPLYYAQLQTYIYFMDTEKNPALFTFMNANDCEVHAFMIPYDGVFVSEILNKAETVIRAILAGETLERGTDDQDSFMCRFCDFKTRCWA